MKRSTVLRVLLVAGVVGVSASGATAAPIGLLNIDSGGNGVRVTNTTIDWVPLGGGSGSMLRGFATLGNYDSGTLTAGVPGTILDLPPVPVDNFMTFAGHPALSFDLLGIGPGSSNTDCSTVDTIGESCSAFAGSPFTLTLIGDNLTTVSLGAFGTARDASGASSWTGLFSTQFTLTPVQILSLLASQGFVDSTYSGTFTVQVTPVPEPMSLLLFGTALAGAAVSLRRRR